MYCIYKFYKHFPFIYIIFEKFCFINKPFIEAVVTFNVTFKTTKEINIYIMIQSAVLHVLFSPPPSFTSENKINVPCHIASVIS